MRRRSRRGINSRHLHTWLEKCRVFALVVHHDSNNNNKSTQQQALPDKNLFPRSQQPPCSKPKPRQRQTQSSSRQKPCAATDSLPGCVQTIDMSYGTLKTQYGVPRHDATASSATATSNLATRTSGASAQALASSATSATNHNPIDMLLHRVLRGTQEATRRGRDVTLSGSAPRTQLRGVLRSGRGRVRGVAAAWQISIGGHGRSCSGRGIMIVGEGAARWNASERWPREKRQLPW